MTTPVDQLLNSASGGLSRLADHAAYLQRVTLALKRHLGEPLAAHCRVANVRDGVLILQADSPVWAAKLRFLAPAVLRHLAHEFHWREVGGTRVRVRPRDRVRHSVSRGPRRLSAATAKLLKAVGEETDSAELRDALLRLSRHGTE